MTLFIRTSDKTPLQRQLDRERAASASTMIEEVPAEQPQELEARPIFAKRKKEVFHVDLMGGWVKP
ncbi:MAG TPA: hypothetical protein VGI81_08235 [Tepidisphaeraceae bacterium]|jgi:hypothetical protein